MLRSSSENWRPPAPNVAEFVIASTPMFVTPRARRLPVNSDGIVGVLVRIGANVSSPALCSHAPGLPPVGSMTSGLCELNVHPAVFTPPSNVSTNVCACAAAAKKRTTDVNETIERARCRGMKSLMFPFFLSQRRPKTAVPGAAPAKRHSRGDAKDVIQSPPRVKKFQGNCTEILLGCFDQWNWSAMPNVRSTLDWTYRASPVVFVNCRDPGASATGYQIPTSKWE